MPMESARTSRGSAERAGRSDWIPSIAHAQANKPTTIPAVIPAVGLVGALGIVEDPCVSRGMWSVVGPTPSAFKKRRTAHVVRAKIPT